MEIIKRKRGRPRKKPLVVSEDQPKLVLIRTTSSSSSSHVPVTPRQPELFKLFLSDQSSQRLKLPKHVTREFGESIKERSTIKDLCGQVWHVSMEKTKDGVFFIGKEWEDFISYHSLKMATS